MRSVWHGSQSHSIPDLDLPMVTDIHDLCGYMTKLSHAPSMKNINRVETLSNIYQGCPNLDAVIDWHLGVLKDDLNYCFMGCRSVRGDITFMDDTSNMWFGAFADCQAGIDIQIHLPETWKTASMANKPILYNYALSPASFFTWPFNDIITYANGGESALVLPFVANCRYGRPGDYTYLKEFPQVSVSQSISTIIPVNKPGTNVERIVYIGGEQSTSMKLPTFSYCITFDTLSSGIHYIDINLPSIDLGTITALHNIYNSSNAGAVCRSKTSPPENPRNLLRLCFLVGPEPVYQMLKDGWTYISPAGSASYYVYTLDLSSCSHITKSYYKSHSFTNLRYIGLE